MVMKEQYASNGYYNGLVIVVFYWLATFLAFRGTASVGKVTKYGVLLGTIIPGALVILLGLFWVLRFMGLQRVGHD